MSDNRRMTKLEARPDMRLTGIKHHGPMPLGVVGDWFAGEDGEVYFRAYHHESSIVHWYHVARPEPADAPR